MGTTGILLKDADISFRVFVDGTRDPNGTEHSLEMRRRHLGAHRKLVRLPRGLELDDPESDGRETCGRESQHRARPRTQGERKKEGRDAPARP